MKKIIYVFIICLIIATSTISLSAQQVVYDDDNSSPRAVVSSVHFCGHCSYSNITTVFDGYLTTPGRIVEQKKKLVNIGYDQWLNLYTNPYVVYRYVDSYGNVFIPFTDSVYSPSSLQRVNGNFGSCPGIYWE